MHTILSVHEKVTMLRCLIALAYADGAVTEQEEVFIRGFLNKIPFLAHQKEQIDKDFLTPQDFWDLFYPINNPILRASVFDFCLILAHKDGVLHPSEKDILDRLHVRIIEGIDFDHIRTEARAVIERDMTSHDVKIDENRPVSGISYYIDHVFLKMGIDLLRS
jgi:uncharacterized membrane protein YebE (DUF533 family)